jgi:hypothetical protein
MNGSSQTPQSLRDRGLEFLKKGKDMWNEHKDFLYREKGYEIYKKGLSYMVDYAKSTLTPPFITPIEETDTTYKSKITENLTTWIKEAKSMEATIVEERAKLEAETAGLTKSISDPLPSSNKGGSGDNKSNNNYEEGKDNKYSSDFF